MSCYEWERGTITLPTAAAKSFRDTIKREVEAHKKRLYDEAQKFWKLLPPKAKRDAKLYQRYVWAYVHGNKPGEFNYQQDLPPFPGMAGEGRFGLFEDLSGLLSWQILHHMENVEQPITLADGGTRVLTHVNWVDNPPRRAQQKDVDAQLGHAKGTEFEVRCGEPSYRVKGRVVTWEVPSNNHACEHGREHPLAQVLFRELGRVQWTRGSGGQIVGNNEYNEGDGVGAGGNYLVEEFGPEVKRRVRSRY